MDSKLEAAAKIYNERGFAKRSGYGKHPALLIIDMTKGFTDPASPMGSEVSSQIEAIQVLLKEFRAQGLPIFYTVNLHDPDDPGGAAVCGQDSGHRNARAGLRSRGGGRTDRAACGEGVP